MRYKKNSMKAVFLALFTVAGILAGGAAVMATPGNYGPGAQYQVELSANVGGPDGGGVWLWLALYPDGTVDYAGSDCGHGIGAVADKGDATWQYTDSTNTTIQIDGVLLNGLPTDPAHGDFSPYATTITIPAGYGHYKGDSVSSFETLPYYIDGTAGFTQLQVAK